MSESHSGDVERGTNPDLVGRFMCCANQGRYDEREVAVVQQCIGEQSDHSLVGMALLIDVRQEFKYHVLDVLHGVRHFSEVNWLFGLLQGLVY